MISYTKLFAILSILLVGFYGGMRAYTYFLGDTAPTLTLVGIEPGGSYGGTANFNVKGTDDYKVARVSIFVDDKPLLTAKVGKKSVELPVTIDTLNLAPGKHMLTIELLNGLYHTKDVTQTFDFYVDNLPLQAAFVKNDTDAKVLQGRTLHLQFQTNKVLKHASAEALSKTYPCFAESSRTSIYECFIPIDCEEVPNEYLLVIHATDLVGNELTLQTKFQVVAASFKKQTVTIAPEKIKHENETGASEKQFEADIEELTKKSPAQKLWTGRFVTPIELKDPKQITTEFGVIRATQERGLRQHKALDVYTTPKSVVWATQDGIVALKGRYAHSGNTVVIDHGYGLLSLFFHLDTFAPIEVGEKIKKGNPVGTLGKTGYATGWHLHWEMRLNNVAVDPLEWTKQGF